MPYRANNQQPAKGTRHLDDARNGGVIRPRREKRVRQSNTVRRGQRISKDGAPLHHMRTPARRNPKLELESAIQRFVDLYDFAPIAYVSFDRTGRIEEANLAATELLGVPRELLLGRPFAFYVTDL